MSSSLHDDAGMGVEQQAENAHGGEDCTPWAAIRSGHADALFRLLSADPGLIHARGAVGETLLHAAYLHARKDIARALLARAPSLVSTVYEAAEYEGENVLHMQIAAGDVEEAKFLISLCPQLIHGHATGRFFSARNGVYYGETPLAFAVCMNKAELVTYFLTHCGADLTAADAQGNTPAHMCVLYERLEMYQLLQSLWDKGYGRPPAYAATPLSSLLNADGCSPIVLAAALGKQSMFSFLWEQSRVLEWSWASVSAWLYPLRHVDGIASLLPSAAPAAGAASSDARSSDQGVQCDARRDAQHSVRRASALQVAEEEEQESILMTPHMLTLLDRKWNRFAFRYFIRRLVRSLVFLACFTLATIQSSELQPACRMLFGMSAACEHPFSGPRLAATLFELVSLALALVQLLEQTRVVRRARSLQAYFRRRGASMFESICTWVGCTALLLGFGASAVGHEATARVALSLASVFCYSYLGWFLLGFRLTGPFVVMIIHMITQDFLRFASIACIFIFGFSQAFFTLTQETGSDGFLRLLRSSFISMISPELPDSPDLFVLLPSVVYIAFGSILMLNLLIAMMGDTYSRIHESAEKQYQLERTRIILSLEDGMTVAQRLAPDSKYWTLVGNEPYLLVQAVDDGIFCTETATSALSAALASVAAMPPAAVGAACEAACEAASGAPAGAPAEAACEAVLLAVDAQLADAKPDSDAGTATRRRRRSTTRGGTRSV